MHFRAIPHAYKINMDFPLRSVKSKAWIMGLASLNLEPAGEPIHVEHNPKPAVIIHAATVGRFIPLRPADFPHAHFE